MQVLLQSWPGAAGQGVCVERGERPEGCDAVQAGHAQESAGRLQQVECSVVDPDPYVFGPPGPGSGSSSQWHGSGSFYHRTKIVRKTLIPTVLLLLFDFLSLKYYVNVPLKGKKQKTLF
jgi:hypothetical protein